MRPARLSNLHAGCAPEVCAEQWRALLCRLRETSVSCLSRARNKLCRIGQMQPSSRGKRCGTEVALVPATFINRAKELVSAPI